MVRPDAGNTDNVWIGDQSVSINNGFPIAKTDVPIIIPATKGRGRPHMTSPTVNQILYWCAVVG